MQLRVDIGNSFRNKFILPELFLFGDSEISKMPKTEQNSKKLIDIATKFQMYAEKQKTDDSGSINNTMFD